VENAFKARGLRCDVLILSPRLSEQAVLRRQILEGVLAVLRLTRANLISNQLSIQIFDHSRGKDNVNFEQYENIDIHVGPELVLQKKSQQTQAAAASQYSYGVPPSTGYGAAPQGYAASQTPQQPPIPAAPANGDLSSLLASLSGHPNLPQIIATLQAQQKPAPVQALPVNAGLTPEMSLLLSSISGASQPQPVQGYAHPPPQPQYNSVGYGQQQPQNSAPPQHQVLPQQQQPNSQPDMREIMAQLANYQR
jgi:hypothetical protein